MRLRSGLAVAMGLVWVFLACQVVPTPPTLVATPANWLTPSVAPSEPGETAPGRTATPPPPTRQSPTQPAPGELAPFPEAREFARVGLPEWHPTPGRAALYTLPVQLEGVTNLSVADGLTSTQRQFLAQNGFAVIHSQEEQFSRIRERVAMRFGQPYYLTGDAALHALYLTYFELLGALEREALHPRLVALIQATLDETLSYLPSVQGLPVEADVRLAAAYLGVALKLLQPDAQLDPAIQQAVETQVAQVMGGGEGESTLISGYVDDFGAYRPTGRYTADAQQEAYFRGLAWLRRARFGARGTGGASSKAPLVITLALRRAAVGEIPAAEEWAALDETLAFLSGRGAQLGPRQYAALMDQVYGRGVTIVGLGDEEHWQLMQILSQQLPQQAGDLGQAVSLGQEARVWRFLDQPFDPEAYIFQNLTSDRVGTPESPREAPSGLDVMAVLGSQAARGALEDGGAMAFRSFPENLGALAQAFETQAQERWLGSLPGAWWYAFRRLLLDEEPATTFPVSGAAWEYRKLNSALGSWAERHYEPGSFTPPVEPASGEAPPSSGPAPAYVEPDPSLFYRLAYIASSLAQGLELRGMRGETDGALDLMWLEMNELGERFRLLGDTAAQELEGETLSEEQLWAIQAPLGPAEERTWLSLLQERRGVGSRAEMPPLPALSAVVGDGELATQVGTGLADRIYVIVPVDGQLAIAQGGVYSYYEFPALRDDLFSSEDWRKVVLPTLAEPPPWNASFILPDGNPVDVLAFRVGDVYRLADSVSSLNVHAEAKLGSDVVHRLQAGDYVIIVDGPVRDGGLTWWKLSLDPYGANPAEGWAVEDQSYFERAWGQ